MLPYLRKCIANNSISADGQPTYRPVAQVTFSILRPDDPIEGWIQDPSRYVRSLASIAVVNACKHGGLPRADVKGIEVCFRSRESAVRNQIEALKPDVVVIGGITWMVNHWFPGWHPGSGKFETWHDKLGARWVHAYHPAQRTVTDIEYVRRIGAVLG